MTPESGPSIDAASAPLADAWSYNTNAVQDWLARQRAFSARRGLWNDETGLPTQAGMVNALQQWANGVQTGTIRAPMNMLKTGASPDAMTIKRRPDVYTKINKEDGGDNFRYYDILAANGERVGYISTRYKPGSKKLDVRNVMVDDGSGSLGSKAVMTLRDQLLADHPEAEALTGRRISGASKRDAEMSVTRPLDRNALRNTSQ